MAGFGEPTSDLPPEDALLVRPSSYSNYALCGLREVLRDAPGYEPGSNEAPGVGTGIHALIDYYLTNGEIPDRDAALILWQVAMIERGESLHEYASDQYLQELAIEAHYAVVAWHNEFWLPFGSQQETLAHEERVLRGLGVLPSGREVWVSGQADRVVPGQIQDWKTASRGWKSGKALANTVQINAYAWLTDHLTTSELGMHVVYDRGKRTWSWQETTLVLTPATQRYAMSALWQMAVSLDAGIAVATPHVRGGFGDGRGWHCTPAYCPAWNACDFRHLIPDGRGDEVKGPIRWGEK